MKFKQFKEELEGYPDDAEVVIELEYDKSDMPEDHDSSEGFRFAPRRVGVSGQSKRQFDGKDVSRVIIRIIGSDY